jgi:hypothetical protein
VTAWFRPDRSNRFVHTCPVAAIFALVRKVVGNLRLFRKEPIRHAFGWDLGVDAFSVAAFAAQNPFRLVCHGARLAFRPRDAYPAHPLFSVVANPSTGYGCFQRSLLACISTSLGTRHLEARDLCRRHLICLFNVEGPTPMRVPD